MTRTRISKEATSIRRMISEDGDLALKLSSHLLGNFRWKVECSVQAHNGERLQGSDFRAE